MHGSHANLNMHETVLCLILEVYDHVYDLLAVKADIMVDIGSVLVIMIIIIILITVTFTVGEVCSVGHKWYPPKCKLFELIH